MRTTEAGAAGRGLVGGAVGLLVGVVLLNAVLLRGYTWFYDMVFVPDLPLSARTLGTDGSVPRAVPTDAVVALLGRLIPGDVLQAGLLMAVFVVAGAGCGRLCRTPWGATAAAMAAGWNPYVVERLVIGHWSFLLGYATLPWIVHAARAVALGDRRRLGGLGGWLAVASLAGSTSALIAAMTAVVVMVGTRRRDVSLRLPLALVAVAMVVLNLAWLVPSLTRPGGVPADAAGVDAFAARSDSAFGTVLSLVTLGGIWHQSSWPGSRASVVSVGVALLVILGLMVCLTRWRLWGGLRGLAAAGALGLVVASLAALPGGHQLATWIVTDVPGGGIIRDSQKFVAPLAIFLAVAAGHIVDELVGRSASPRVSRPLSSVMAALLVLAPVATLPDAPSSAGGRMGSVEIPASVLAARDHLDASAPGGVAVFPWTLYRRFAWNDDRVSLDPWNRLLDRRVLVNDDLDLASRTVRGEDPAAATVGAELLRGGTDLRSTLRHAGVRWALVLADQPGAAAARRLLVDDGAVLTNTFDEIDVYDLGAAAAVPSPGRAWPLWTSLLAALLLVAGGAVAAARPSRSFPGLNPR